MQLRPSSWHLAASLFGPALSLAVAVGGCKSSGDEGSAEAKRTLGPEPTGGVPLLGADCDPLVPTQCLMPFPSNVWLADDATTPSGKRVRFGATSLPKVGSRPISPAIFADLDGFSPGQPLIAHLPGASTTGLVDPAHIGDSLADGCATVVIDAETGERVPHWVDLDLSTRWDGQEGRPDQRALMIRPAVRLKNATRYVVAIRHVVDGSGAPIPPSPTFRDLRDGGDTDDWSVVRRRDLYDKEIFPALAKAGVARGDLQLAWDFTTASRESLTRKLLHMRDDALAKVGDDGPTFTVKKVEEEPSEHILRRITLEMTVPSYLDRTDYVAHEPGPRLVLGEDGLPRQHGTLAWRVLVHVPKSVTGGQKHGLLQNGHGLFGSAHEGEDGYLAEMCDGWRWIGFSTSLMGFAGDDVPLATDALSGTTELLRSFIDLQHQGHLNQLLAMRMMMGRIAKEGIEDADGNVLVDPAWIDREVRAYRGDSQGGIMGGTYISLSTDVTRALLGEPGMPYALLLNRSADWPAFGFVLGSSFPNALDVQAMLGLIQMVWDQTEPDGWAAFASDGSLPNTPKHQILIHDAIGDHQVPTLGAHLLARAIGAVNLRSNDPARPLLRDVWGVPAAAAPVSGENVMVEYDFGLTEPLTNLPTTQGCDPHDRVRSLRPSYEQSDQFFRTGTVGWFCDGICNCDGPGAEVGCGACEP